jgi:hypothetical protein
MGKREGGRKVSEEEGAGSRVGDSRGGKGKKAYSRKPEVDADGE